MFIMKISTIFKSIKQIVLSLTILVSFFACQTESIEISQPSSAEVIQANSTLSSLMRRTATKDGSKDNIIDRANCLEVKLPVTVVVNNIEITINSEKDFDLIEEIYNKYSNDIDKLNIQFPITIVTSDYQETKINNQEELNALIKECVGENQTDDDIECVDFVYPISFSIYNTAFEVIETKKINSDKELFFFMKNLDGNILASLNFPVALQLANGTKVVAEDNKDLERIINEAKDSCEEDDDYDYTDDDKNCDKISIKENLKKCSWIVKRYTGNEDVLKYKIEFHDDFTFTVYNKLGDEKGNGEWMVKEDGNQLYVKITSNATNQAESFIGDWKVKKCDGDSLVVIKGDTEMKIEQNCPEFRVEIFKEILMDCNWLISYLEVNGDNLATQYADYVFNFKENGTFTAKNGTVTHEGVWVVDELTSGRIAISLSSDSLGTDVTDYYLLKRLDKDKIYLQGEQNHVLKFQKKCSDNNTITKERVTEIVSKEQTTWKIKYLKENGVDKTAQYNTTFMFKTDGTFEAEGNGTTYTGEWNASTQTNGSVIFVISSNNLPEDHTNEYIVTYLKNDEIHLKGANDHYLKLKSN